MIKKGLFRHLIFLTFIAFINFGTAAATVTGLNNTGIGAVGTLDASWSITSAPAGASTGSARVVVNNALWTPNSALSKWLVPQNFVNALVNMPTGNYTYQINFSTTNPINLTYSYSVDNQLMGVTLAGPTGYNNTSLVTAFSSMSPLYSIHDIQPGNYTFTFLVFNSNPPTGPGPVGLNVRFTTTDIIVPEPMTYASLGMMLVLAFGLNKLKEKREASV